MLYGGPRVPTAVPVIPTGVIIGKRVNESYDGDYYKDWLRIIVGHAENRFLKMDTVFFWI